MLDKLLPRSQTLSKLASERRRGFKCAILGWKESASQVFFSYKPSIFFFFAHSQRALTGLSQSCLHL